MCLSCSLSLYAGGGGGGEETVIYESKHLPLYTSIHPSCTLSLYGGGWHGEGWDTHGTMGDGRETHRIMGCGQHTKRQRSAKSTTNCWAQKQSRAVLFEVMRAGGSGRVTTFSSPGGRNCAREPVKTITPSRCRSWASSSSTDSADAAPSRRKA